MYGPSEVSLQVNVVGTSATYKVEQTLDNPSSAGAVWFDHPDSNLVAATTSKQGNYAYLPRAVRLNVSAISAATVTLTVLQGG
jgi:hypothetical protein